ncbi:potassium-transporting ATPase subunit KdpC [Pendulispora albinea]|uniref:Potassium-transporting ATPase KdpC subunit n=1 Tax=Pendulispora albinea TaxID=2741071 RepID=A0ABZ2LTS4_9BACT
MSATVTSQQTQTDPQPSFGQQALTATGMLIILSLITGLAYPLLVTGIAHVAMKDKAEGSLIVRDGKVVGSRLVGQPFEDPKHFWGRISATSPVAYNAGASSGSNLGPTNEALTKAAQARIDALREADPGNEAPIPVDLATASGSGLDPHISLAAAEYQVGRVARARGIPEARVRELVAQNTEGRDLGILGEPRVNVLALNLALDARSK